MPTRTARFVRHHPLVTMFTALAVLIAAIVGPVLWVNHVQIDRNTATNARFIDFQVDTKISQCENANGSRKALQSVLDAAAHPPASGAARVDFTAIEGFAQLDRGTRFFLTNLQAALGEPGGSAYLSVIANNYRKNYPSNLDCRELGHHLRLKLEGIHA